MSDATEAPLCRFNRDAAPGAELVRIAATELDYADAVLEAIREDPIHAVHECRKTIKRLRALLRLALRKRVWRPLDDQLGGVGTMLAQLRDDEVLAKKIAELVAAHSELRRFGTIEPAAIAAPDAELIATVKRRLAAVATALAAADVDGDLTVESLRAALDRGKRRLIRRGRKFLDHGRRSDAHHWRKQVQRYANQLRYLSDIASERAVAELTALDALARVLGDFNDLTVLRAGAKSKRIGSDKAVRKLLRRIAGEHQRVLKSAALSIGDDWQAAAEARPSGV